MLRSRLLAAGAGLAGAIAFGAAAGTGVAFAMTQDQSDTDIYDAHGRVSGIIAQLENLRGDYNGNRVNAIAALHTARTGLIKAITTRGGLDQTVSDQIIRTATGEISLLIKRLSADEGDYGGGRQSAVNALSTALTSLNKALGVA